MRRTTDKERREFEQDFKLARPIKPKGTVRGAKKSGGGGAGLDGGTQDRLDKGQIAPGARLDLHGMTEAQAHRSLLAFLPQAHASGIRLVLLVTGKGNPRAPDAAAWTENPHGVLKQMVPRWLAEPQMARLIAKVQPSHLRHGGAGALYVYLSKNR